MRTETRRFLHWAVMKFTIAVSTASSCWISLSTRTQTKAARWLGMLRDGLGATSTGYGSVLRASAQMALPRMPSYSFYTGAQSVLGGMWLLGFARISNQNLPRHGQLSVFRAWRCTNSKLKLPLSLVRMVRAPHGWKANTTSS
ncbi:hypothetical protein D3C81_1726050 [compost metagenome]